MSEYLRLFADEEAEKRVRIFVGTDPGAGAEVSVTVPAGSLWELRAIRAILVADGTVANRTVRLTLDDGATVFWEVEAEHSVTASQTMRLVWATSYARGTRGAGPAVIHQPLVPVLLRPGCRITTVTTNLQAGDNWASPALYVLETVMRSPAAQAVYEQRLRRRAERIAAELGETRAG